ncbi:MAG TPA: ring-cleaving dioxygenase [Cyclobacteriaceae bacterium]|jgi:glyoxalase family protein|nr:ring-cleaving dioxygenase [Cytophagales bacterium]HMR55902.1 ring-cleaving dioxygenase [Cyclobacteriaceae bacterium]HNT49963.1 ring-cleaving dioxygenase [Cyclobacteriaceae bacterium]
MKPQLITGIHHVTAMADDAQKNLDFYTGILGLRMVKKTVNFDAPDVYHFYYGNETGSPGTIMTFFPFAGMAKGRHGKGQMTVTSFSVPAESLDYWITRLKKFNISFNGPHQRFDDEMYISLLDNHGLALELVFNKTDLRPGFTYGQIPLEYSVKGFHGAVLSEDNSDRTAQLLLESMDHKLIAEKGNRKRFSASGVPGDFIDVLNVPEAARAMGGSGTIHHLAFATADDKSQLEIREKLLSKGLQVTEVLDRQYFHSIYFREPGGVLFEVATNPPGFAVDEHPSKLGEALKLPAWYERMRDKIEDALEPVTLNPEKFN